MLRNDCAPTISLDGEWEFRLGDADWSTIQVPGCWEAQGYSKRNEGPAYYRRSVMVPTEWREQPVILAFDAVSYASEVLVNGERIGDHFGLWTPFSFDISSLLRYGEENQIDLVLYKPGERYPVRASLAGFLPDVATTFGGIWKSCRLIALPVGFDEPLWDADLSTKSVRVRTRIQTSRPLVKPKLSFEVLLRGEVVASSSLNVDPDNPLDLSLALDEIEIWSPDSPSLYEVRLKLLEKKQMIAEASAKVGFRKLSASGKQVLLNDKAIFLRGALSWGWDPDLIAPNFSDEAIRDEIRRVRELGFNMIKLCLFVPNQRYYEIADEEGMLIWQEWPMWLPKLTASSRLSLPKEYAELMHLTRHHPSVVIYSIGCELNASIDGPLLKHLNTIVRELSSGVLICDNSGSGEAYGGLPFDFADFVSYHTYADIHHFEPILDNWLRGWQAPRPWIFGETCDQDAFRDHDELIAANGGQVPWWMTSEIPVYDWRPEVKALVEGRERLQRANLGFSNQELSEIGTKQALMIRKFWLEALRRRPETGGYVITGLRDTPIATAGVFDDFGRSRGTPEQYRCFNADAVLSMDVGRRRRWIPEGERVEPMDRHCVTAGTPMRWHIILSHTSEQAIQAPLHWKLVYSDGRVAASGSAQAQEPIVAGIPREAGVIDCTLPYVRKPEALRLEVSLDHPQLALSNSWPIWIFPRPTSWPERVGIYDPGSALEALELQQVAQPVQGLSGDDLPPLLITNLLSEEVQAYIRRGGRVLLLQGGNHPLPARRSSFWREALKLFPQHPIWEEFPVDGFADMQFFTLGSDVSIQSERIAEVLPDAEQITSIMRRLDARHFDVSDYLLELKLGAGRLLVCSLRLQGGAGAQPWGIRRNVTGLYLLMLLLQHLSKSEA